MAQFFRGARGLFVLLSVLSPLLSIAQVPSGCWQGLEVAPQSAYTNSWPSVLCLSVSGNVVTGTLYQVAARNPQYFVEYEMTGSVQGNTLTINHGKVLRQKFPPGSSSWCFGQIKLTYDPNEEKLTGTAVYKNTACGTGNFELYRIALKTADTFCKGTDAALRITGKNVKWYAEPEKKTLLAEGNAFTSVLSQTTTFYVTQTQYGIETPPVPIKIEIVELILTNVAITPATCGKTDGTISLSVTGGSQVQYSLNNGPFQSSPGFSKLPPGTYTVNAKVANCHLAKDVIVSQQETPKINAITPVQPTCGSADGALTVAATGGSGSLSYSINGVDFKPGNQFGSLAGGDYTVTVRDQNQCAVSQLIALNKTVKLQLNEVTALSTTCGQANGRIRISNAGGNGIITYSVDNVNYKASNLFDKLRAGTYTVSVNDETGCRDARTVTIGSSAGPAITQIRTEPATCGKTNAKLSVQTNGPQPLQFAINGKPYPQISDVTDLAAGVYKITISDGNACALDTTLTISQQDAPVITALNVRDPTCGKTNGEIQVVANGSKEPLLYSIDGTSFQPARVFSGLAGSDYTVSVRDPNNCVAVRTAKLIQAPVALITGMDVTATTCGQDNGNVSIRASAPSGALQYSLDSLTFQANPVFTNLKAGVYTGLIRDANGCTASRNVEIRTSSQPEIVAIQSEPASCVTTDGRLIVNATGTGNLSYSLDGVTYQREPLFSQLPAGAYELGVKDELNCVVRQSINVDERCEDVVHVPAAFTPNGDGTNDHWTILFPFPSLQLQDLRIFNRWGAVVYHQPPLLMNSGYRLWNGFWKGDDMDKKGLVSGTYAYQLTIQFATGKTHVYRGTIQLIL